ncbi:MAG: T9SS type A sorting domain-containing protein [Melioribacteraceae bacterium]|nr:T9SS type A sorting domain-containing protein [Melioribacteraceae bacterium]
MKFRNLLSIFIIFLFCAALNAQTDIPQDLTVKEINHGHMPIVQLKWDYSKNTLFNRISFTIYRKNLNETDSEFIKLFVMPFGKIFYDKMVIPGGKYKYYVTAVANGVESDSSNNVQINLNGKLNPNKNAVAFGVVTNETDGTPVAHAHLKFIAKNIFSTQSIHTNENGEYLLNLYPGEYFMYVGARSFIPEFYENTLNIQDASFVTFNAEDSLEFNFELESIEEPVFKTLSGRVTDSLGNPVKAHLFASKVIFNSFHNRVKQTRTDDDGNYNMQVIEGDTLVVYARPIPLKDYIPEFYNDKFTLAEADRIVIDADKENIDFILGNPPLFENGISGTLSDTAGNSVMAHILAVKVDTRIFQNRRVVRCIDSDSLGNYELSNLVPGNYILAARPENDYMPTYWTADKIQTMRWKDADTVYVDSVGIIADVNFTLYERPDTGFATIEGNVARNGGKNGSNKEQNIFGAYVYALDENGQVKSYGIADGNGKYQITGLVPGTYSVVSDDVNFLSEEITEITVDYSDNLTQKINLSMSDDQVTAVDDNNNIPSAYSLDQNYPNPFNPATSISFNIVQNGNVKLEVFNILGQKVVTLLNKDMSAGYHRINFNAANLSSGIYLYSIKANDFTAVRKMTLLK